MALLLIPLVFSIPVTVHVGDRVLNVASCTLIQNGIAVNEGDCGSGNDVVHIKKPVMNSWSLVNKTVDANTKNIIINIKNPKGGGMDVVERLAAKTANCSTVGSISSGGTCNNGAISWNNVQGSVTYTITGAVSELEMYEPQIKFGTACGIFIEINSPRNYAGYMMKQNVTINGSARDTDAHSVSYNVYIDGIMVTQGNGNIHYMFAVDRTGNIPIYINASSSGCGTKNLTIYVYGLEKKDGVNIPEMPPTIAVLSVLFVLGAAVKRD